MLELTVSTQVSTVETGAHMAGCFVGLHLQPDMHQQLLLNMSASSRLAASDAFVTEAGDDSCIKGCICQGQQGGWWRCWCLHVSILCSQAIGVYQQAARLPDAGPAASSKASALSKQLQRQRAQARKASREEGSSFNFASKEDANGRANVAKKPAGRKGAAQATPNGHAKVSKAGAADGAGRIGQAPVTGVISNDEEYEAAKQQAVSLQMALAAMLETATLPCACMSSTQCKLLTLSTM